MAIEKLTSPAATPTTLADWQASVSLIEKLYLGQELPVRIDYDNDLVLKGSVFQIGGSVYVATADTAITGTPSDYVKLTPGVSTATAAYVANLTGVTWNDTYNGYYDGSGNIYIFDEMKAKLNSIISDVYKLQGGVASNLLDYVPTILNQYSQEMKVSYRAANSGGDSNSGSWRDLDINTTDYNNIVGASRSGNEITLPAGAYIISGYSDFWKVGAGANKLLNDTDATDDIVGGGIWSDTTSATSAKCNISGKIEIAATKVFKFQYKCGNTVATTGLGNANGVGIITEFRALHIRKVDFS